MRRAILAVAVAAAAVILPVLPASNGVAATSFSFYGSGYGHGLGLSQWGSFGLANDGWSHQRILKHFYKGTTVAPAPSSPSRLRIGLVQETKRVTLTVVGGSVTLRLGSPGGTVIGRPIKQGETWYVVVDGSGKYRVLNSAWKMVGGHLWGGLNQNIFATYAGTGKLNVAQAGHTYNRGYIEFNLYQSRGCVRVPYCERLIIILTPQPYLYGLGEVPSGWPTEALRAQADAARTYAFEKVARLGQHRPVCNCALYDDTRDQVYAGWDKEGGPMGSRWVSAVTGTNLEVVLYDGKPIQAYYFSSSGGYTENNENVWGGTPLPYLRGVCDPGDYTQQNPSAVWKVGPLSADTVTKQLRPYTGRIGTVTNFTKYVRGVSGRIITVTVVGTVGQKAIAGWMLRAGLRLKDDKVWINANWNITGQIRTKYDSLDCAPGLAASRRMAIPGGFLQRFADGAIYWNTAANAASWENGPVYQKYVALGEFSSPLGLPTSDVIPLDPPACAGITCAMAKFDKGNIYSKEGIGAYELHGYVLEYYLTDNVGGYAGHLGFPVTDVTTDPQNGNTSATFEHGTVTCPANGPESQCIETGGAANLLLGISGTPNPVRAGRVLTYVVRIRNGGPSLATGVVVTDSLPASVKLLSKRPSQGTCTGSRTVTCSLGRIRAGRGATITLTVRTTARGRIRSAANVRAREWDPRRFNNSATIRTRVM